MRLVSDSRFPLCGSPFHRSGPAGQLEGAAEEPLDVREEDSRVSRAAPAVEHSDPHPGVEELQESLQQREVPPIFAHTAASSVSCLSVAVF